MLAEKILDNSEHFKGSISERDWCEAIIRSAREPGYSIGGIELPNFPEERLQNLTIKDGASESMLRGANKLYQHVKSACSDLNQPVNADTKILDFGCGWGRIVRFFLKEIDINNIYGVEVLQELAEACESTFNTKNFHTIEQSGSLPFEDGMFDVVFANSVFSHLNVDLNMHWLNEIERVTKPGGVAALTIIDTEKFESMSKSGSQWFESLGVDCDSTREKLNSGEFIWVSTNRTGSLDGYGLTFIPVDWINENWTGNMKVVNVNRDYSQSIVVLQKN